MIEEEVKTGLTPDRDTRWMWFYFFAGPLTWVTHLVVGYSLHRTACESSNRAVLLLVSLLVLVPILTGWRAFAWWQSLPDRYAGGGAGAPEEEEPRARGRERFLLISAFVASGLFTLMILGQTVHMLMLRPCD